MPVDCDKIQCWTIAFCLEALQLTSLLTEITHVEQAAHFTCALKLAKCQAVSEAIFILFIMMRLFFPPFFKILENAVL